MRVLDLQCAHQHVFEGWFSTEADFIKQLEAGLVECPICADACIIKRLSAPRLNLSHARDPQATKAELAVSEPSPVSETQQLAAAWMHMARHVLASTTDVGERFAEEARKIHYGESEERGIRGKTTLDEARALVEEGIAVEPLLLPEALKEPLH